MSFILAAIIAFVSIFVPGILLALALLNDSGINKFEMLIIGFVFGMIAPATMTWAEYYLIPILHGAASFSLGLFELNVLILSIVGAVLCWRQGLFKNGLNFINLDRGKEIKQEVKAINAQEKEYRMELSDLRGRLSNFEAARKIIQKHVDEEADLTRKHRDEIKLIAGFTEDERRKVIELHSRDELDLARLHENEERQLLNRLESSASSSKQNKGVPMWVWYLLAFLIFLTFATRMLSVAITPRFFEFDPYFDMLGAEQILTYGFQPLYSTAAWPVLSTGSISRIQPVIPYLEAYWYSLANYLGPHYTTFNTTLMSYVGGIYAPITAALLVFVIFMLLYREYDAYIGLIGAGFATAMPVLFTTFVSGEQLLEPWGIFSLFFFFAAYMMAVKNMKSKRLAIFAGIAFASTFLGAHYFTVDAGILALYIIFEGMISSMRGDLSLDFYKMNSIVIIVIALFLVLYEPYHAVYGGGVPTVVGIPVTIAAPLFALLFVFVVDYLPKYLHKRNIVFKDISRKTRLLWMLILVVIALLAIAFTPVGKPIKNYINESTHFTTPSTPLFMTVQEFMPTGLTYNFGSAGLGIIASSIAGAPVAVYLVLLIGLALLVMSVYYRKSNTGMLYLWIVLPLAVAAFSEVKYLPHFGAVYILLVCIIIGEIGVLLGNDLKLRFTEEKQDVAETLKKAYVNHKDMMFALIAIALFFLSPVIAALFLVAIILMNKPDKKAYMWALLVIFLLIEIITVLISSPVLGESASIIQAFSAAAAYNSNSATCGSSGALASSIGADLYCNVVPNYWLLATAWMQKNIGPKGARVLAWWDYGDWINWFGQSPAFIRGDNAVPNEDYAVAATFVLGKSDNYSAISLANLMNTNQSRYVLFDEDLVQKWGALDFLACIHVNATSQIFAEAQGAQQTPPAPYVLGQSQCELTHDPQYVAIPLGTLDPAVQSPSINDYCSISNNTVQYALSYLTSGASGVNQSVCVGLIPNKEGILPIYYSNGTKFNAVVNVLQMQPGGVGRISSSDPTIYAEYLMIYLPNGPNDTITNAPSEFYTSSFYKGFFFGKLPGFTEVYPVNATGINFVNGTWGLRILELNNFTGQLPKEVPKPSYIQNNYSFP